MIIHDSKNTANVDLRGRLDPDGQRMGKLIEYKNSELRLENILENTCKTLRKEYVYRLYPNTTEHGLFIYRKENVNSLMKKAPNEQHTEAMNSLDSVCFSLVTKYKNIIWDLLKKDATKEEFLTTLCYNLKKPSRRGISSPFCDSTNDNPALIFPLWNHNTQSKSNDSTENDQKVSNEPALDIPLPLKDEL